MQRWWLALCLFWLASWPAYADQAMSEFQVRVQVQGAVRRPGIYRLPTGSRLAELVAKAGGPRPDARLQGLNLARRLTDGELCYVPSVKEATPRPAPEAATAPPPRRVALRVRRPAPARSVSRGPLNLNTASLAQLDTLPGVGPGLASAILRVRSRLGGRFRSVEDLREVQGIGQKRFDRLRPLVRVD
jgi:competence protein ComEA